ncbi:Protein CBG20633 [Caenorhabditis briggsae]|uniref:Protein kinase domain-containing protein n=2 Tax=Caenorhabditis briggsae TaxID=6238 RepID=A0AAE9EFP5_CAEBR|nr:Protein CBG20633 [Caenorhabditis briggsae]UMM19176.1 hypothetical protein L5515_014899 [Caenorhabditis briggsae]CAP37610.2 Protein CBG20633 [Caenorhabditis briggsae]
MMNGYGIKDGGEIFPVSLQFGGHKLCGSGRFSNVYCGQMIGPIKKEVAVKNVWSDTETRHLPTTQYPEVQILSEVFHPAISNLLYFYSRNANNKTIHCLVLDYLPSEMAKLRDQGVKFDVLDAKFYTFQLFCAISHLASKNIVHMDIKPQNVIMDRMKGLLKLADFGNARRLETSEKTGGAYQVTRFYRPPELLFGCEKFTPAIDIWSATCVAFELFANRVLFRGKDTKDQIMLITGVLGYPTDEDIKSMGVKRPRVARKEARGIETFTSKMLDPDMYEFMKSTLKIDPKKRKTAADVLKMSVFDVIKAVPRKKRSNGMEVPNVIGYTEMNHKRECIEVEPAPADIETTEKAEKESKSSSSHSTEEETRK